MTRVSIMVLLLAGLLASTGCRWIAGYGQGDGDGAVRDAKVGDGAFEVGALDAPAFDLATTDGGSSDAAGPTSRCLTSGFCWERPLPDGQALRDGWASSSKDIFVVGYGGTILHYDGLTWSEQDSGVSDDLESVHGDSPSNVYAVGDNGTILHFDGKQWSNLSGTPGIDTTSSLYGVYVLLDGNVYIVGAAGRFVVFDGSSWTTYKNGPTGSEDLHGVWAATKDHVVLVGDAGTILHYDGAKWISKTSASLTKEDLRGVWGSSTQATDLHAAGSNGTLLHYDGNNWSKVSSPTTTHLRGRVWGASAIDVYAVGYGGQIVRYDGVSWIRIDTGTDIELRGVFGTSSSSDIYAVGLGRNMLHSLGGLTWTAVWPDRTASDVRGFWGEAANGLLAVGENAWMRRRDGAGDWKTVPLPVLGGATPDLNGAWGSGPADVYVAGDGGTLLHYAGSTTGWRKDSQLDNAPDLNGVWGVAATTSTVVLAGDQGTVWRGRFENWTKLDAATTTNLNAVWVDGQGDAFVVGDGGTALRCNAASTTCVSMASSSSADLHAVVGRSGSEVYAAGDGGTLLLYDGNAKNNWKVLSLTTSHHLYAATRGGDDKLWIVGDSVLLRSDSVGGSWSEQPLGASLDLRSVWMRQGVQLVGGAHGTILRRP